MLDVLTPRRRAIDTPDSPPLEASIASAFSLSLSLCGFVQEGLIASPPRTTARLTAGLEKLKRCPIASRLCPSL